jgi:NitT/TauT family transport system substrate-binding protein
MRKSKWHWLAATAAVGTAMYVTSASAADEVTVRLNTILNGWHCPWHMARDKGWFAEAGITIKEIGEGRGSGDTIQLVAAGTDTFGLVDPSVVIASAARALPVKAVFSLMNKSSLAVVSSAEKPIKSAEDLKGKTYVTIGGSAAFQLFQVVLKTKGLSQNDVRVVTVDPAAQYTTVMSGQADAILIGLDGIPDLEARGFKPHALMYADLGVNTPVSSVATHASTIQEKPDLVRRFIAVTQRAWNEAVKNPEAVVDACIAVKPTVSRETYRKQLDVALVSLTSPNTQGRAPGWGSEADWDQALQIQKEYRNVKTDQPAGAFFTNEFLPK